MKKILVALAMVMLLAGNVWAARDVQFGWNANTETDLAGYRLYQSNVVGSYTKGMTSPNFKAAILAPSVEYTLLAVPDGTWYWVLTAYDTAGNESGFSNEVTLTIDTTAPSAPGGFWAQLRAIIASIMNWFRA